MKVLLDTNFILTCVKQGIDFDAVANGLFSEDIKWIVPVEVLRELRGLKIGGKIKVKERNAIDVGLEIIQKMGVDVVKMSDANVDVDTKIVNYLRKNEDIVLATLDKELKGRVKNRIMSVRGKKNLVISS